MEKFRSKLVYEVIDLSPEGFVVKGVGDLNENRFVVHPDIFSERFEKVEDENPVCIEPRNEHLLFEALHATKGNHAEDYEFREKVKAKLEKLLGL